MTEYIKIARSVCEEHRFCSECDYNNCSNFCPIKAIAEQDDEAIDYMRALQFLHTRIKKGNRDEESGFSI